MSFVWAAFFFQGLLITVDEFLCHRRRVLPKWELIGHPVDTFCLLGYFLCLKFVDSPLIVAALGVVSTVIITKDEWVHKELSTGFENWLHAMLFVTHAALVLSAFLLWRQRELAPLFLTIAISGISFFLIYQIFQGGMRWKTV
jgi:hypothetical protein